MNPEDPLLRILVDEDSDDEEGGFTDDSKEPTSDSTKKDKKKSKEGEDRVVEAEEIKIQEARMKELREHLQKSNLL